MITLICHHHELARLAVVARGVLRKTRRFGAARTESVNTRSYKPKPEESKNPPAEAQCYFYPALVHKNYCDCQSNDMIVQCGLNANLNHYPKNKVQDNHSGMGAYEPYVGEWVPKYIPVAPPTNVGQTTWYKYFGPCSTTKPVQETLSSLLWLSFTSQAYKPPTGFRLERPWWYGHLLGGKTQWRTHPISEPYPGNPWMIGRKPEVDGSTSF
ncbi:hypothetical protein BD779DRAFT_1469329 [Infundibulicybe gibba]|nr:hypothetical protein BD779DRAFT_1469329 [Infundibulicybe gibba]